MKEQPDVSDLARIVALHVVLAVNLTDPKDVQRYLRQENLEQEVQDYVAWLAWLNED